MPQNLEQIRAAHALASEASCRKEPDKGDALSGYPSLIGTNGIMATLAYSRDKGGQYQIIANAIASHLQLTGVVTQNGQPTLASLLAALARADSFQLRHATEEALAFLAYLKRFAKS